MSSFKFEMGDEAVIVASGEKGMVIGRAEYQTMQNNYWLRYMNAKGEAVEVWWGEDALVDILKLPKPVNP